MSIDNTFLNKINQAKLVKATVNCQQKVDGIIIIKASRSLYHRGKAILYTLGGATITIDMDDICSCELHEGWTEYWIGDLYLRVA